MGKKKTKPKANGNAKSLGSQQSVNAAVKAICDIMRRSNCAGAMQYVPELTWILFLRILDERETQEAEEAEAVGVRFTPSLKSPYRWQDWAAPNSELREQMITQGKLMDFVNQQLLPYLRDLENTPNATPRQKVIGEVMSGVERVRIDTQKNLCDVCDKVTRFGRNIRHKHSGRWERKAPRTNRQFRPNVHRKRMLIDGRWRRINICTRCLRTQMKQPAVAS